MVEVAFMLERQLYVAAAHVEKIAGLVQSRVSN